MRQCRGNALVFSSYSVSYHIKLPNLRVWVNAARTLLLSVCEIKSWGRVLIQNIRCKNRKSFSISNFKFTVQWNLCVIPCWFYEMDWSSGPVLYCRCKHECPWMILGPYDGVEKPPCDTRSFISHTWLHLINQVRGPSLTYRHTESVSKSHLGRWQLKCDVSLWLYSILFFRDLFYFSWMEKKNDIKAYSS